MTQHTVTTYDPRSCHLGEGPLWHPKRDQLFWFDINNKQMLSRTGTQTHVWQFDEHVSAAGWVDDHRLLIASETALFLFDLETGTQEDLAPLEANMPHTRSNDGRADPWGGFWIGTMGKQAQSGAGSIYRYYRGTLTRLYSDITISNAICFSPDHQFAYYTDTPTRVIMRQPLDGQGWPIGAATPFVDLRDDGLNPDGAVVDAHGYVWNAQWGASQLSRYTPQGALDMRIQLPTRQPSCPAFGGTDLKTLFCTSATENLDGASNVDGTVQSVQLSIQGQAEHQVILDPS